MQEKDLLKQLREKNRYLVEKITEKDCIIDEIQKLNNDLRLALFDAAQNKFQARRQDLEGKKVKVPNDHRVWLIASGKRHYIASPVVLDALFSNADDFEEILDIEAFEIASPLLDGTRLVRSDSTNIIYILIPKQETPALVRIANLETFTAFGFSFDQVLTVPHLFIEYFGSKSTLDINNIYGGDT